MEHCPGNSTGHYNKRRKYELPPSVGTKPRPVPLGGNQSPWNTNPHIEAPLGHEDVTGDDSLSESSSQPAQPRKRQLFDEPPTMIDWRRQLCRFLKLLPDSTSDNELLENLRIAAHTMQKAERLASMGPDSRDLSPHYEIIHRVRCAAEADTYLYLEEPYIVNSGPQNAHLRGSQVIDNFDLFLERNKTISFIAYKDYRCCGPANPKPRGFENILSLGSSYLLTGESVALISPGLQRALQALASQAFSNIPYPSFELDQEFSSPYLWWYHSRTKIEQVITEDRLDYEQKQHIVLFQQHLMDRLGKKWAEVDNLLANTLISADYIEYLFVPNTIIVSMSDTGRFGQQQAYVATSWLVPGNAHPDWSQVTNHLEINNNMASVDGIYWAFDGNFVRRSSRLTIDRLPSMKKPFNIRELAVYPISFADPDLKKALRKRGEMFWQCRQRNYVCYSGDTNDGMQGSSDPRFMIDIATYKQMHPTDQQKEAQTKNDLDEAEMSCEKPPQRDEFLLCLPKLIPGFNMNKKEWTSLDVSRITPVKWNMEAFDSLVVDKETKELISALVTNQIDAEKSTDLMSGKGNGLFILLHGGPGTGKTLTAESVAEYSQKPLYRVTCGDIGTKAEEVEKYLEVVMLLGKTWGCVVLLDEADVFLEQRKISDLQRNALVSVFLRVLEYYDGILILTSNRVGTFDEAFKSRIQLTLRYKNLGVSQRRQVWENFIVRLESFQFPKEKDPLTNPQTPSIHGGIDLGINSQEVRAKLDELAEAELNGREIRNAVSTARQLAMFRKEPMGYKHIQIVIEEAKKFDKYLKDLNQGFTTDQIMKDAGERLS